MRRCFRPQHLRNRGPGEKYGAQGTGPDASIALEHQFRQGDPAKEILRMAQDLPCDLIVMGTHGRTGLAHLLMGSVAEQIVRRAPQ